MVLHDIANNTKVVKVAAAALSPKGLLESEDHTGHTVPVPDRSKDTISKPVNESFILTSG